MLCCRKVRIKRVSDVQDAHAPGLDRLQPLRVVRESVFRACSYLGGRMSIGIRFVRVWFG